MNKIINTPILQVKNIFKVFRVGSQDVTVLNDIDFDIQKGDFLIIYGPSGCGKSTLLHTILGLEKPTKGTVVLLGKDIYYNSNNTNRAEDEQTDFRKKHIGMVYQQANWIKSFNILKNVAFPLSLLGVAKETRENLAKESLKTVGMSGWANYSPSELSSGQQQKVALARALITNPEIIITDEPTGNLDFESGQELMSLLSKLNQKENRTIIMVTHDLEYLKFAKNTIKMFNGKIIESHKIKDHDNLLIGEIKYKKAASNEK